MTVSSLDTMPRVSRGVVSNAEPAYPFDRSTTVGQALHRAAQPDYAAWLGHVRAAAGCTRPMRLIGRDTVDPATGNRIPGFDTASLPDGVIYKACGNRRSTVCPACAETYRRDAFQLLRAGLVGGKGVPDSVSSHPAVFATFTAPSFGPVHTRVVRTHTCTSRRRCDCRPDPCRARRDTSLCVHGNPAVCFARHDANDTVLGRPLCLDCYDHDHQVVWNNFSGELWRRTKQAIERYLARLARQRGIPFVLVPTSDGKYRSISPVRVSHGKAAEFQIRGAVHFHALLRLDGVDPHDLDAVVPPPHGFTSVDLDDAVQHAARQVHFSTPEHPDRPAGWPIAWGDPDKGLDVRHLSLKGGNQVTDEMAAGYLAKYSTKSTEATGHASARLTAETVDVYADPDGDHIARLIDACWRLGRAAGTPVPFAERPTPGRPATRLGSRWSCPDCGNATRLAACPHCSPSKRPDTYVSKTGEDNPYVGLRRWAHMLGFGGHFLTKARRYSVTFQLLRDTRIEFRRAETAGPEQAIKTAEHLDEETTLVVGPLSFAGIGWHTSGDALLANTAAAMARERQQVGREELAHEIGSTLNADTVPVAA